MTSDSHTITERSLEAVLLDFFRQNPDEELSTEDISVKWDVPQRGVHSRLSGALLNRLVQRRRDESGNWHYSAGPELAAAPVAVPAAAPTPKPTRARGDQPKPSPPAALAVDLDKVQPQDGVPLPERSGAARLSSARALLARMNPGQCTPGLPRAVRYTLSKAITQAHAGGDSRYVMRTINRDQIRVWRTQ